MTYHIPQDGILHTHRRGILKPHKRMMCPRGISRRKTSLERGHSAEDQWDRDTELDERDGAMHDVRGAEERFVHRHV
jgi:hypothetical protein